MELMQLPKSDDVPGLKGFVNDDATIRMCVSAVSRNGSEG